jgi:hypothetical protein
MLACLKDPNVFAASLISMVVLSAWFALQFPFANADGMMTPKQMMSPHPKHKDGKAIPKGIPLTGHGSTFICMIALNPILSCFIANYWHEWMNFPSLTILGFGVNALLLAHLFGHGFSILMHMSYVKGPYPEAHMHDGRLTLAGIVHMIYFGEAVTVLIMVYALTPDVPADALFLLTAYMSGHIWIGNHFINRINRPEWFPDDYRFGDINAWIPVLVIFGTLCAGTWFNMNRRTVKGWLHELGAISPPYAIVRVMAPIAVPSG